MVFSLASYFFVFLLPLLLCWFFLRLFMRRGYFYVYEEIAGKRVPKLVGYLKKDGIIIDLTQMIGQHKVGQVTLEEGNGLVRVYDKDLGEGKYEVAGKVDPQGYIYEGLEVLRDENKKVNPEGERHWYELWLRRHSPVYDQTQIPPFGKCVETGRFRHGRPNTATLLARAGAALALYWQKSRGGGRNSKAYS
jgi:hypothetical protein